ncbi:MAG: hypothetical protein EOM91_08860 [Sphingobacteriia bacterium]|nr:hypothetical protein [Sphingobacteriia bacterium]NCC37915.1 hypothetical protein [Gammaproteobacteria bacterium]
MNLDERERGLIELIGTYREEECRKLLEQARLEARSLLDTAWRRSRAQLHEHVLMERANARSRLHAARADRDTRLRASGDRLNAHLLELAWPRLREALLARWADRATRRVWTSRAIEQALRVLPVGRWTLRHPPDWVESEWSPLVAGLTRELGQAPRLIAEAALSAGLVIANQGAVLDASLEGLLRDRRHVESRLLAILAQAAGAGAAEERS